MRTDFIAVSYNKTVVNINYFWYYIICIAIFFEELLKKFGKLLTLFFYSAIMKKIKY